MTRKYSPSNEAIQLKLKSHFSELMLFYRLTESSVTARLGYLLMKLLHA